jgi:hypothetical protein
MRRTRRQWAEHRNEQRALAECQQLVDAGEGSWLEPVWLSAAEALELEGRRWVAETTTPTGVVAPTQLELLA